MFQCLLKSLLLVVMSASLCSKLHAQSDSPVINFSPSSMKGGIISEQPMIDGNVISDPVWQSISPITQMRQNRPNWGEPASEQTEIRVAFTPTTLYVSAVCYDASPDKIVITDSRRDASLDNMDAFLFIIDTYHDQQNGFVFGTNALGLEYDAQVVNEGGSGFGGNRQQRGNIGGFNLNWDASWTVKSVIGDFGWSTEFAIPLSTIRFATGDNLTWGINFRRNIRKTNEIDYWSLMPLQFNLTRLSLAGTLTGLSLTSPGNLKFIPYVLGKSSLIKENGTSDKVDLSADIGADIKYSITPSLTLDVTYNTDFAQVEVDEQQVNLDRFNLFFPEKRPFFLENAGIFSVGSPGEVDLFFSRKIGIGSGGTLVPITGGARVSGKINNTNVGLLTMFTEDVEDQLIPQNNFSVARINHEFKGRSSLGGVFISKQSISGQEDNFNHTYAVDGKFGIGKKAQLTGFFAQTNSNGLGSGEHAYKMQAKYDWDGWILNAAYTEVGEGFNPEVGFLRRSSFRKPEFLIFKRIRPDDFIGILELRPHISYRSYYDFDGFLESSFLHIDNHWEWKSGIEIHTGINFKTEGVKNDFNILDDIIVPEGIYRHSEAQIVFRTNQSNPISFSTFHRAGGFFGGTRYNNRVSTNIRLGSKFNSTFSLSNNIIQLPDGEFDTNIFTSRLSYSFNPRLFTQALVQYNSVQEEWSSNIRFGWLQQANSGLFLVLNTSTKNNSFLVKYSRVFDLL
ncbi:MAG: DUF5916 domain-containing protein [Saprospiraceae bacterium]